MKKQIITFTNVLGVPDEFQPTPGANNIPEWYKKTESYILGDKKPFPDGATSATVKRCMPVFDAITGGYIIVSPADVYVSQQPIVDPDKDDQPTGKTGPYYSWSSFNPISFHVIDQAPLHPAQNGFVYPKWTNPWSIKTPKGYSTMFVQPFHRESLFTILPGIVDTDKYTAPVNFPFVMNDTSWEGLIPAGTPIAQVIPFKRDDWKMKIGNEEDLIQQAKVTIDLKTKFFDGYKNKFRSNKEYK